ncbi:MAG: sensor domain-containing diguanylate cyclase [Fimbriimonadales bacterium]|nr:sensor domain-containing diguanylate cyclase [Fimbriimonadales bacterium]
MRADSQARRLADILREAGVRTTLDPDRKGPAGFPVRLCLRDGSELVLELPEPALLQAVDPGQVGVAVLDGLGYARRTWGLAARCRHLRSKRSALTTELGPLVQGALGGVAGSLYLDGLRYHAAPLEVNGEREALLLVTNASAERAANEQAGECRLSAEALRRIGRALAINPALPAMASAVVHETASVAELACALLWVRNDDPRVLHLQGAMGANRDAARLLEKLRVPGGPSCAAELVAETRRPLYVPDVSEHLLTAELEARFCYLKPGGACVLPLEAGGELLGVLELVGRSGDAQFASRQPLFRTLAEQVALGLHGALIRRGLEQAATRDPLTGLLNHRRLHEELRLRLAQAERSGGRFGLLLLDVDHFRSFNEEEGHLAGDQVLRQVAEAIRAALRPYDAVGRYGGEEFVAVLPDVDGERCRAVAERVREAVRRVAHTTASGRPRSVTASIGCAAYPDNGDDPEQLLRAADAALYKAKRAGRDRVELFVGLPDRNSAGDAVDLETLWRWVAPERRSESVALGRVLDELLPQLRAALGLSKNQQQILRALTVVLPEYREAVAARRTERLQAMRSAEEFRLLLPSLETWDLRADGGAPVPLLARVLAVVESLATDGGRGLLEDPGRYDPEVLRAIQSGRDAA